MLASAHREERLPEMVRWERPLQPTAQRPRPHAVAYAIATLINNLFGRSSDFWQQAYTDLPEFVITLRRITDF